MALSLYFLASAFCPVLFAEDAKSESPVAESPIADYERDHWAYRPLVRPTLPAVENADWTRNAIDRFILADLQQRNLQPQPPADRTTLIRRLYFDLLGLPPSPQDVDAFLADDAPDAYERLVDRLLASHHYGERWAQHWLDLARFAETDGFEHDKVRENAWRYRDWVIASLNADLPYDRFVALQIAGDQLRPDDPQAVVATAFCLSGPDMPDINSQVERKHNVLNELTAAVGSALLGLQLGCAQCHDHKYDAVSQADFYRLRAVFDSAVELKKNVSLTVLNEMRKPPTESHLMLRGDWQRPGPVVEPDYPRIANPWGDRLLDDAERLQADSASGARRVALAQWLTRGDHPLTTRVIANRLWQHHFGAGLSRTPSDFGVMGDSPTSQALLDWLATELVRRQWSLKAMHRLIATSATYRQASRAASDDARQKLAVALESDPNNYRLARFPRRRLSGEEIRDAMLSAAGVLDTQTGGPGVMPPLPPELKETLLNGQWREDADRSQHDRRSVYVFARRNLRYPLFDVFDRPDGNASCPVRSRSTTATQSLTMINSELTLHSARRLAGYVLAHAEPNTDARLQLAYRRALGREPTADELHLAREFLTLQTAAITTESRSESQLASPLPFPADVAPAEAAALVDFCLALLNTSEFVYVD
ncbi:MAG: DUF1549 and DUF1553 domain-containing protein [Pirellulaceae bacterium]